MNRKCVNLLNPKLFPYLKLRVSSQGTAAILSLASFAGSQIQSSWFSQHLCMTRIFEMVLWCEVRKEISEPRNAEHYMNRVNWLMQKPYWWRLCLAVVRTGSTDCVIKTRTFLKQPNT